MESNKSIMAKADVEVSDLISDGGYLLSEQSKKFIVDAIKSTLDGLSPELASDLVDSGMLLCGGGALLRGLDRFVAEQTGLPARVASDPLGAVAKGTLICLEHFDQWRPILESSEDDV